MTNPPRRVVIVGASFAGLFAAAAIARAGTRSLCWSGTG
jgi:2-polyprenyl-6-methoxyphenol hydroxylase-like FAD-dependent oxidoreductase